MYGKYYLVLTLVLVSDPFFFVEGPIPMTMILNEVLVQNALLHIFVCTHTCTSTSTLTYCLMDIAVVEPNGLIEQD